MIAFSLGLRRALWRERSAIALPVALGGAITSLHYVVGTPAASFSVWAAAGLIAFTVAAFYVFCSGATGSSGSGGGTMGCGGGGGGGGGGGCGFGGHC